MSKAFLHSAKTKKRNRKRLKTGDKKKQWGVGTDHRDRKSAVGADKSLIAGGAANKSHDKLAEMASNCDKRGRHVAAYAYHSHEGTRMGFENAKNLGNRTGRVKTKASSYGQSRRG